jgi:hypothetical protein
MPADSSPYLGAGTEYTRKLGSSLAVAMRGGYNTVSKDVGGSKGFTLGLGLKYSCYSIDYAYMPLGDIGDINRFSLSVQF